MRLRRHLGLLALSIALTPLAAAAAPAIVITHPWIALPPGGAPNAAGYLTIKNAGDRADVFLGGATGAAQKVELHSMETSGGVMRMRPVAAGVSLPPGGSLILAPGNGYHLMLFHPNHDLKLQERIPVTLSFAKAGSVKATFVVEAPGGGMAMP
jgi:copper(I)-binding protein